MSRARVSLVVALTLSSSLVAGVARADRRSFTRTYEYMTMPKGGLELEFYNTQTTKTFEDDSPTSFKWQIEVEYGITDHWDVSLYQVFGQSNDPAAMAFSPLKYSETKLRTRYRLGERGEYPVDTLLYFEVKKPVGVLELVVEPKLIVARDFGKATLAVNLIAEAAAGDEFEFEEAAWAVGATYELMPAFKLGGELFGAIVDPSGEAEVETWVGPSFSWGPSPALWIAANAGFGVTEASADFTVQAIIGVGIK
jgi:hypothetical protein